MTLQFNNAILYYVLQGSTLMIKLVIFVICSIIGYSIYTGATSMTDIADAGQQVVHNIAKTVADATD